MYIKKVGLLPPFMLAINDMVLRGDVGGRGWQGVAATPYICIYIDIDI